MRKLYLLALSLLLLTTVAIASQSDSIKKERYVKSLRLFYQAGSVLQTNSFLQGDNELGTPIDSYQSASLQYGIETNGKKLWQQIYGYPTWGFGFYSVNFFDPNELGNPSALYTFINAPLFKRFKRWSINYEVGFGLTYNWKKFDANTNAFQYAIGSSNTVFIDLGLNADIMLGKRFNLTAGFTFTHFSNGATKVPNLGINLFAPRIGLKYMFKDRPDFIVKDIPKYNDTWEYIILFAASSKQLGFKVISDNNDTSYVAETYGIFTFSTGINRQISHKVKIGVGADIGYDASYNSYIEYDNDLNSVLVNAGNDNKLAMGFYGSFELVVNRLSLIIQPGWYVYREKWEIPDETPPTGVSYPRRKPGNSYQRVGLKYHILENAFAGINIRAYDFSIADYIEWNIGYRIQWK